MRSPEALPQNDPPCTTRRTSRSGLLVDRVACECNKTIPQASSIGSALPQTPRAATGAFSSMATTPFASQPSVQAEAVPAQPLPSATVPPASALAPSTARTTQAASASGPAAAPAAARGATAVPTVTAATATAQMTVVPEVASRPTARTGLLVSSLPRGRVPQTCDLVSRPS